MPRRTSRSPRASKASWPSSTMLPNLSMWPIASACSGWWSKKSRSDPKRSSSSTRSPCLTTLRILVIYCVHGITIAEIATGKLTTKLTREGEAAGGLAPYRPDFAIRSLPPWPPGPGEAPPVVWPEHGKPIGELITTMKATRERSRSSVEKLATLDPEPLVFKHFRLVDLDLAQWWLLQAQHDRIHLGQPRDIKRHPGFPRDGAARTL